MSIYKDLSAVVVTHNSKKYIVKTLKEILKVIPRNSIYIFDNNSADNTISVVKSKYPQLHLIHSKRNLGFAAAINNTITITEKKYVLIINPDTKPNANALTTLLFCMRRFKADIVGGKMVFPNGEQHRSFVRIPNAFTIVFDFTNLQKIFKNNKWHREFYYLDNNLDKTARVDAVSGGYMIVKRESFVKLGGFDTKFFMYLEDVDLGLRAKQKKMKVLYCPDSQIIHYGGGSSDNKHRINYNAWNTSRIYYINKHFHGLVKITLLIITFLDIFISSIRRE